MVVIALGLLGLCLGSFVNALVWRLYQQALPAKRRVASDQALSLSKGRSMCPHCQHVLGVMDLLPVVSWLWLRGRCRYCRATISAQYPLVELAMAAVFVGSYLLWPYTFDTQGIFLLSMWLLALVLLMALLIYDFRWMLLPNRLVFPLIGLGVIQVLVVAIVFDGGLRSVLAALFGLAVAGGIFFVLFQVSKGRWIGGGDVKLGFALGLILGSPLQAALLLFVASLLGCLVAVPGLVRKKLSRASRIPFGPYLIVAMLLVVLCGRIVTDWYVHDLLLLP